MQQKHGKCCKENKQKNRWVRFDAWSLTWRGQLSKKIFEIKENYPDLVRQ